MSGVGGSDARRGPAPQDGADPDAGRSLVVALRALDASGPDGLGPEQRDRHYVLVLDALRGYLAHNWSHVLDTEEREDIATDVVLRLTPRSASLVHDGYVYRAAYNAAVDRWRHRRLVSARELPVSEWDLVPQDVGDDVVAARIDVEATADEVARALAAARDAGDVLAFTVVTAALDRAQTDGRRPSNRVLAAELGVSHTAVNNALGRFRRFLDAAAT